MPDRFALALLAILVAAPAAAETSPSLVQCMKHVSQDQLAAAEPFCVKAAEESNEGRLVYADMLLGKGDIDGALGSYTRVIKGMNKDKPTELELEALLRRAMVSARMDRRGNASDDLEKYLKHRTDDIEALQLAFQTTLWNDQREDYASRLIALKPDNMEFRVAQIQALLRSGKKDQALAAAEAALKVDPKSTLALTWRGFAYQELEQYTKAERDHAAVAKLMPASPDPRSNRAYSLIKLERYADAIDAASQALAIKPDHFLALQARAQARLMMGDGAGALADIKAAKAVAPPRFESQIETDAAKVIAVHETLSRAGVAQLEADRATILQGIRGHLGKRCGYYRLPDYEDNVNLQAYRKCMLDWAKGSEQENFEGQLDAMVMAASERFYESEKLLNVAELLLCSKMPKKSKCVDEKLFDRVWAAHDGMDQPFHLVAFTEWQNLDAQVHAYNARLSRKEAWIKTANFLDALANALAEQ